MHVTHLVHKQLGEREMFSRLPKPSKTTFQAGLDRGSSTA